MTVTLHEGDCLEVLAGMPENSVDAVVTDPPYHLTSIVKRFGGPGAAEAKSDGATGVYGRAAKGFMGKTWDGGDVAFRPETWAAVLRVLKPGGYLLAFASTRGFCRMGCAIQDAGFIEHPFIAWLFGTGFPKATRVKAKGWEGWRYGGQALKPAIEPIFMGQKPFSEATGTANILRWGTGALNIDGCRIPCEGGSPSAARRSAGAPASCRPGEYGHTIVNRITPERYEEERPGEALGRWPANVVHDGSDEVLAAFPEAPGARATVDGSEPSTSTRNVLGLYGERKPSEPRGDAGSAARFFYSAKADAEDRWGSKHPTVKPVELMRWLVRMVTPPGGVLLDPFAGSGTTGVACLAEGFGAVLIEREAEYAADIRERLAFYQGEGRHSAASRNRHVEPEKAAGDGLPLFWERGVARGWR